ncbi:hypothetical protein V3C10_04350 [[Clostridium] symbiosum]|uniref:hypothetical protein n=1 Tax=Clostridium symbiosum TaxID=1512 RepID=UPI001D06F0BF|nr:hypothetical protein [[Clostridium] symbiosum]MCB6610185.1 hypothetical protein [[Clostridium] symbiosum]MCB6933521.1 hypothetical protein [[Clostridium] symbiosum]
MWQEPKTNWSATDFINVGDYNRIKNNLAEIRDLAVTVYPSFSIIVNPDKKVSEYPYADEINQLEENLETIRGHTLPSLQTGSKKTFYANQPYIKFDELNRLESACLLLYQNLVGQTEGRPRLEFTLGGGIWL